MLTVATRMEVNLKDFKFRRSWVQDVMLDPFPRPESRDKRECALGLGVGRRMLRTV